MSTRQAKVEALLRREVAEMLLRGDIRDPRLSDAAVVSITGVRVSADLASARIFVDVLAGQPHERKRELDRVLAGLNAAAGVVRNQLGRRVRLRRIPTLRFEHDLSIDHGARIEAVLSELRADEAGRGSTGEEES